MDSLHYVDFMPQCLSERGILSEARFERFDNLMTRANEWLSSHANFRIVTCESVEVKQKSLGGILVNPEKMSFYEYGEHYNRFVRALRLWVRPNNTNEPPEPQQIKHINIVPATIESAGIFSRAKFENLAQTLERVNAAFRERPLDGCIINIETQDMKYHKSKGNADPDECSWREDGEHGTYFLMVLRVFYIVGLAAFEEIGTADFVPRGKGHDKESFESNLGQARDWVAQQQGIRFINVQSIDYKLKKGWGYEWLDTHRTMYHEQGDFTTRYVRIIRVCYGKPNLSITGPPPANPMPILNYKTFAPVRLSSGGLGSPVYETMSQTWNRAMAWLRAANVYNYLSVETVPIRMRHGRGNSEVTYSRNVGDWNEYWVFVIRLYIHGSYQEPPPDALPPLPSVDDNCCAIL